MFLHIDACVLQEPASPDTAASAKQETRSSCRFRRSGGGEEQIDLSADEATPNKEKTATSATSAAEKTNVESSQAANAKATTKTNSESPTQVASMEARPDGTKTPPSSLQHQQSQGKVQSREFASLSI